MVRATSKPQSTLFNMDLSVATIGSFDVSVTASFLGEPATTSSFEIDLRDLVAISKALVDLIGDGFSYM